MEAYPRNLGITIQFDTNCINAKQKMEGMNQIEKWHDDHVILLYKSFTVHKEASKGSIVRKRKACQSVFSYSCVEQNDDYTRFNRIGEVVFPGGLITENQYNDVDVVYNAINTHSILVTHDGDSISQPGGILGHREQLFNNFGLKVMRDSEAVIYTRELIATRDEHAIKYSSYFDLLIPEWVGKD